MKKLRSVVSAVVLASVVSGCGLGGSANERTILVDYSHDEFASAMFANFPATVSVPQGASVVFKQTWTGEPHTVTGGELVDEMMSKGKPWMDFFTSFDGLMIAGGIPDPDNPTGSAADFFEAVEDSPDEASSRKFLAAYEALVESNVPLPARDDLGDETFADFSKTVTEESDRFFEEEIGLPWAIDETKEGRFFIPQNAGQPCYLQEGAPPKDSDEPCDDAQQEQPTFDGTASYYNSGIIPYEGPQGNTFRVQLADDIEPGSYFFYCAVHGPGQYSELKVVRAGEEVPSQEAVNREAREEIAAFSAPMLESFRDARDGEVRGREGPPLEGPFAGLSSPTHGTINEFVPKQIETRVGEPVTWKLMGADHSVSFDVPRYFPIMQFAENGRISLNPQLQRPAGGSPTIPDPPEEGILEVDGGTYDGDGFFSSGLFGGEPYAEYTLRFSEAGTYTYACLLHPPMVGTVVVR